MIKFYTAVGTREIRMMDGKKKMVLSSGDQAYFPSGPEAILWHSALWVICTARELKEVYENQVSKSHLYPEISFERYLNHLEEVGLISSGQAETMEDALYDLMKDLFIEVPRATPVPLKVKVFLQSVLTGMPIRIAKQIFQHTDYPGLVGKILRAASCNTLTTSELICWGSRDKDFSGDFLETVYGSKRVPVATGQSGRFAPERNEFVQAVSQLYLDREIMFEKAGVVK